MADNKQKKSWYELLSENDSPTKIGDYQEAAGGGTPMKKGQKVSHVADTVEEAHQYRKDHPGAIVRVNQPRDEEGHFTYNSANERKLEYGPSRGKTIPPFLQGTKLTFAKSTGRATFIGSIDGKRYTLPENIKSIDDFARMYQEFREDQGFDFFGTLKGTAKGKGGVTKTEVVKIPRKAFLDRYKKPDVQGAKNDPMPRNTFVKVQSTESNTNGAKEVQGIDYNLAKSNPEEFVKANREEIKDIIKLADEKGADISVDGLVGAIASGEVKSFDDIKKALEGIE